MGIIQLLDQTLFLQPLPSHFVADSNKVNSHVVYRRSRDETNAENQYKGMEVYISSMNFLKI